MRNITWNCHFQLVNLISGFVAYLKNCSIGIDFQSINNYSLQIYIFVNAMRKYTAGLAVSVLYIFCFLFENTSCSFLFSVATHLNIYFSRLKMPFFFEHKNFHMALCYQLWIQIFCSVFFPSLGNFDKFKYLFYRTLTFGRFIISVLFFWIICVKIETGDKNKCFDTVGNVCRADACGSEKGFACVCAFQIGSPPKNVCRPISLIFSAQQGAAMLELFVLSECY